MYNNYPQSTVYESQTNTPSTQPVYSNQYERIQYTQNLPMNQPSQPIYDSAPSQSSMYSVPIQQQQQPQFSSYPQYVDNSYMNQQPQSTYQPVPQQAQSTYQPVPQQPQSTYQPVPQQAQSTYQPMPQQPQSTYQSVPQQPQPPPSYATVVQSSSSYPTPVQQQTFPNSNPNSIPANSKGQAAPFTNGYKWPRKSITLNCPKCGASVKTRVETSPTIVTVIACIILFFATVILSCVPFCIRACKRSTHYCPHCNSILGVRHELR